MAAFPDQHQALADLAPLIPVLYDAFEQGTTHARRYYEGDENRTDAHLFATLTRDMVLRVLDARAESDEHLTRVPLINCGIEIQYAGYDVRCLKTTCGELPSSSTETRLRFFQQLTLGASFSGTSVAGRNLVVQWEYDAATGRVDLVLLCTKSGRADGDFEVQWSIPLPHPAEGLATGPDVGRPVAPVDDLDFRPLAAPSESADAAAS